MRITKSMILYNILANIPVCFVLCIVSSLLGGFPINWGHFGINYAISFVIAMCVGLFIPLMKIGKWFTGLFHVKNDTYTNNIKYRLLATLSTTVIYFLALNPFLSILNCLILQDMTIYETLISWALNIPTMLVVGFLSSLIVDIPAYRITKKIDNDF